MFNIGQDVCQKEKLIYLSEGVAKDLGIAYNPQDLEYHEIFGWCLQVTKEELEDEENQTN